jgi:versiconal hemiacetal acetate esterase
MGGRAVLKGSADELQAQFNGLLQFLGPQYPPPSPAVQVEDHDIGGIQARVYTPQKSHDKPLPVGIFAHSGGFVLGSLDSEDAFCRALVEHANTIVVSVDYRLAPEHKAPAQLDDMLKGIQWVSVTP